MRTNSWILTRHATGEIIGEFYDPANVAKFDPAKVRIETAYEYLIRLNQEIRHDCRQHHATCTTDRQ